MNMHGEMADHARAAGVLLLITLGAASAAFSQTPPLAGEAPRAMTGTWEISTSDRERTCSVTFRGDPAPKAGPVSPPSSRLDLDRNCAASLPFMKDAVAWNIGAKDVLRLIDAKGGTLVEFSEVESGMYEGERRGEGIFFMQSVAASKPALTVSQLVGDWNVTRGGTRAICTMTLSETAAGDDGFTLTLKPGCDTLVTRFRPASWSLDKGELVLSSEKGDTWRFEEGDAPSTWRRIPERAGRVHLVRK
jgi:hypothetical protein